MFFQVKIDQRDEFWFAECPAIPACARRANSKVEVLAKLRETIKLCFRIRAEQGLPLMIEVNPGQRNLEPAELLEISDQELRAVLGEFHASLDLPFDGRILATQRLSIDKFFQMMPPARGTRLRYSTEELSEIKSAVFLGLYKRSFSVLGPPGPN